jgi:hypothetical protein
VAVEAREYIEDTVAEFRKQANTDVPSMREEFGVDASANYEIQIDAKYVKSEKTESIVMLVYVYTGGAHGGSSYKVITATLDDGKNTSSILSLSEIIKSDKQTAFVSFVKKQLNSWKPDKSQELVVFPEEVDSLNFDSFANWSLDQNNLIIYFDQYAIGPGALGATAFPLSRQKIADFLQ